MFFGRSVVTAGAGLRTVVLLVELQILREPHVGDTHVLSRCCRPSIVIIVERSRHGKLAAFEEIEMSWLGHPVPMRRFVLIEKSERFGSVAALEIIQREIRDEIGDVAFVLDLGSVLDEHRIVVVALVYEDPPLVETGRVRLQMPLPHDGRLVAGRLQQLGQRDLAAVERVAVIPKTIRVTVFPRQQDGSTRCADRVGDEAVGEANAVSGEAIDVRRLDEIASVVYSK